MDIEDYYIVVLLYGNSMRYILVWRRKVRVLIQKLLLMNLSILRKEQRYDDVFKFIKKEIYITLIESR